MLGLNCRPINVFPRTFVFENRLYNSVFGVFPCLDFAHHAENLLGNLWRLRNSNAAGRWSGSPQVPSLKAVLWNRFYIFLDTR